MSHHFTKKLEYMQYKKYCIPAGVAYSTTKGFPVALIKVTGYCCVSTGDECNPNSMLVKAEVITSALVFAYAL